MSDLPKPLQRLEDDVYPATTGIMFVLLVNSVVLFIHMIYPTFVTATILGLGILIVFLLTKHILEQCIDIVEGYKERVEQVSVVEQEQPVNQPTIRVGDFDVPEPSKVRPIDGQFFWVPREDGSVNKFKWNIVEFDGVLGYEGSLKQFWDEVFFNSGLIHFDEESAKIHAKALKKQRKSMK